MNREANEPFPMQPDDEANRRLRDAVRPSDWRAPEPAPLYDLVVIGAGTAGLVAAAGAAGLGARVALVERRFMGGDCLNFGCVPSKALLAAAHAAHAARHAGVLGVHTGPVTVDFRAVMRRLRETRAAISGNDSAARFRSLGVDVFFGNARFLRTGETDVDGTLLRWRKAVIATGARAAIPNIPGLADADPLTHRTVFDLEELPRRLAVIGAGPVGCELAQAFRRLGSEVVLVASGPRPLPRDEPEAGDVLALQLRADGVQLVDNARLSRVDPRPGNHRLHVSVPTGTTTIECDRILVATGRRPNVDSLELRNVGVETTPRGGIAVDDHLRTANRRIFAAGDVCLGHQFTHAADFSARIVIQNALFFGRKRVSALVIPWCTYTDPEVAHVGSTTSEATARGIKTTAFTKSFAEVDRARTAAEDNGFARILVREGTDEIVGATIVGVRAGELISEVAVAMSAGMGLGKLASVIHPYPTFAEAIRQCGDAYNRTRLTPRAKWFLNRLLRL